MKGQGAGHHYSAADNALPAEQSAGFSDMHGLTTNKTHEGGLAEFGHGLAPTFFPV